MFAAEAARRLGVSDEDIMKALKDYEGIEHRMEYFATVKGIKFVNDCIATIPIPSCAPSRLSAMLTR